MSFYTDIIYWLLALSLLVSSLGILLVKKPIYASLCFLLTLLTLGALYLELSAQFIATMQVLVYAGAILVIFMFVIVLFQDAHYQLEKMSPKSSLFLSILSGILIFISFCFMGYFLTDLPPSKGLPTEFGTSKGLGKAIYIDFFFPFESVILIFLIAVIGSLYIARKERI